MNQDDIRDMNFSGGAYDLIDTTVDLTGGNSTPGSHMLKGNKNAMELSKIIGEGRRVVED